MTTFPAEWQLSTVSEVGRLQLGRQRAPRYHSGSNMRPYLRVANVFENRIDTRDVKEMHFEPDEFERYRLHDGDLLLNEGQSPELLGRPAMYRGKPSDCAFTNSLIRFQAGPSVDPRWALLVFRHYMHSGRFTRESRITTNIAHLSIGRLRDIEFPVPSPTEQRRIVDLLEDHLSRLDAADANLAAASRRAGGLRWLSVTRAVDTAGGSVHTLGTIATSVKNGIFVSRPEAVPDGIPILRISAVRPLLLDLGDLRYSSMSVDEVSKIDGLLSEDDVLFTRYNGNPEYVGACVTVPRAALPLTYPDKLIRVRVDSDAVLPEFLAIACSVGRGRAQIREAVKTTSGQAGISGRDLKAVRIAVPPLAAQHAAIARSFRATEATKRLATAIDTQIRRSERLRQALLQAAFCGRLTPQTSDDEIEGLASAI